jgi:hypothetical protein
MNRIILLKDEFPEADKITSLPDNVTVFDMFAVEPPDAPEITSVLAIHNAYPERELAAIVGVKPRDPVAYISRMVNTSLFSQIIVRVTDFPRTSAATIQDFRGMGFKSVKIGIMAPIDKLIDEDSAARRIFAAMGLSNAFLVPSFRYIPTKEDHSRILTALLQLRESMRGVSIVPSISLVPGDSEPAESVQDFYKKTLLPITDGLLILSYKTIQNNQIYNALIGMEDEMPKKTKTAVVTPVDEPIVAQGTVNVDTLSKRSRPSLQATVLAEKGRLHMGDTVKFVQIVRPLPDLIFGRSPDGFWAVIKSGSADYIKLD